MWYDDWTYGAIDKYFDILMDYMHFEDKGRIYGKGCGIVSMIQNRYHKDAYELGKNI